MFISLSVCLCLGASGCQFFLISLMPPMSFIYVYIPNGARARVCVCVSPNPLEREPPTPGAPMPPPHAEPQGHLANVHKHDFVPGCRVNVLPETQVLPDSQQTLLPPLPAWPAFQTRRRPPPGRLARSGQPHKAGHVFCVWRLPAGSCEAPPPAVPHTRS